MRRAQKERMEKKQKEQRTANQVRERMSFDTTAATNYINKQIHEKQIKSQVQGEVKHEHN